jgi:dipeptidyl aminopeptidase/acylaminoacyl peptidase
VRAGERWLDERRPKLFVQDAIAGAAPTDLLASTPFANSAVWRGELKGGLEDLPATWTPDGTGIVFVGCVNADALVYSKADTELFLISVRGGEATRLTQGQGAAQYGLPRFAPDGHALVVRVVSQTDSGYHLPRLMRYAWPWVQGDGTALATGFDRAAGDPIAVEGEHVLFTADEGGVDKLYETPVSGGAAEVALPDASGSVESVSSGTTRAGVATRLAVVESSAARPPEVYALEEKDGKLVSRRISEFNTARAAGLDLPAESIVTKTTRGEDLQSWVFRPAQFDPAKKYPVIVLVHDGPEAAARDGFAAALNPHLLAGNRYVVIETNYRGSVGFGEAFTQSLAKDPVKGPAEDVMEALNALLQNDSFADGNRIAVIGVGYGGLIANWLQATSTRFRCFVVQGGAANPETLWATTDRSFDREALFGGPAWEQATLWREQNPVALAGNHASGTGWVTPTLLAVGEKDFRVPISATLENWTYLQRLKVPSRLLVFPDEGHELESGEDDRYFMREVQTWLAQWFESAK